MNQPTNPAGLNGIAFVAFSSPEPEKIAQLFLAFGFSMTHEHKTKQIKYFSQGDIHFFLHEGRGDFASKFAKDHGPSISAMGWRCHNPSAAMQHSLSKGAETAGLQDWPELQAIKGIGDSHLYFVNDEPFSQTLHHLGFTPAHDPIMRPNLGFTAIDHLTNNVAKGTMARWASFYKDVFNFVEVRYFDIRGAKTGLTSYALRSPCGKFCIPINEGTEDKSQINEYLREYRGPGIQHLAFLTNDIVHSVVGMNRAEIQTLDIDRQYYREVFDRVPNVKEDHKKLQDLNILIDGDEKGYLLQIFTRNVIGPIFIEIIQRKNHLSFGEGNFQALFRSLERDQERRGVI